MPSQRNLRRIDTRAFVPNSDILIDVPEIHDYRGLMIELSGTLTVASANATSVPADSPCDLIDRVDLIANGKDTLAQLPFVFAAMCNYEQDFSTEITAPAVSQAAHPIRAVGFVDLWNGDGFRPRDSAFQAANTSLFQLRMVTRDEESIIVPGGSTTLTLAATISTYVDTWLELGDANEGKTFKKRTYVQKQFTAANSEMVIDIPHGNVIRLIQVRCTDDGAPDDSLVNDMSFRLDDIDTRHKMPWKATRSINQFDKRGSAPNAGFAVIDSTPEGKITNMYDARGSSRAQLVLDVSAPSGNGLIEVVTTEFIVP